MKLKYSFETMELEDSLVAVPVGKDADKFHGVLKVNDTAAYILNLLSNETTETKIVDALMREYEGEQEQITEYVHHFIDKLKTEGVID